jgi:hypothetical protein
MRLWGLVLAFAAMVVTVPAQATTLTPGDWKIFREESSARYSDVKSSGFEHELYQAAKQNKTHEAIVADFARRVHVDPAHAEDYAELIVNAVVFFKTCEDKCGFAPGTPLYGETVRIAMAEPTGGLLQEIGEMIPEDPAFIRLAWLHPAAEAVFRHLYGYNEDSYYFAAMLLKLPDDPTGVPAPVLKGDAYDGEPDEKAGFIAAIEEATATRLADTPAALEWKAAIAQSLLEQELALGMNSEAVARYLAYPQAVRDRLPYAPTGLKDRDMYTQTGRSYAFADSMAAALWLDGHQAEARALLGHTYPADWKREDVRQQMFAMVSDAVEPKITEADLFKTYVIGKEGEGGTRQDGWLFGLKSATPAEREVVAARLTKAGYPDLVAWIHQLEVYDEGRDPAIWSEALTSLLPAAVVERQPAWAEGIKTARDRQKAAVAAAASGPVHVTASNLAPAWTEKPLPAGVAAWRDADNAPAIPKGVKLPVPREDVLRYDASGKDAAVVFASSEYDLSGEIPAYGLWVALRRAGVWQAPLYLGLQAHFPYVVTPGSHLPLLAGDHLQLEVQVREIDPKTITFPPVDLGYARQADGLYLDIDLKALQADGDSDGLTDIAEARLGLKPDAADSDGDGIPDGQDPLPLTPYNPKGDPNDGTVARIILEHLIGHDAGAIMVTPRPDAGDDPILAAVGGGSPPQTMRHTLIMVSDVDLFSTIRAAPFRLIIYSNADLDRLSRGKAPFYPPRITELFKSLDGKDYYVGWSASWVGGSFSVHCDAGTCTTTDTGGWIS